MSTKFGTITEVLKIILYVQLGWLTHYIISLNNETIMMIMIILMIIETCRLN